MTTTAPGIEEDEMNTDGPARAFVQSDAHTLGDLVLQPYTPSRVVAAKAMGLRHPNIGPEAMEQFKTTSLYPQALQDTLIVLWLCTLEKPEEVRSALRNPNAALDRAIEWAAARGIVDTQGEAFWQAYGKFADIMAEINASAAKPTQPGGGGPPASPN